MLFWSEHRPSARFRFRFLGFFVCGEQFETVLWIRAEAAEEISNYDAVLPVDS